MRIILLGSRPLNHPFPLVSWLIRLAEWSPISHVGIYFPETSLVFHAHFKKYEWKVYGEYIKEHKIVHSVPVDLPLEKYEDAIEYIDSLCQTTKFVNEDYFKLLFGALLPLILRKISFNKILLPNLYFNKTQSKVCSVLAASILDAIGTPYDSGIDRKIPFNTYSTTDALSMYKSAQKYS